MKHDFNKVTNRQETHCLKYDGMQAFYENAKELYPMWVADMDFQSPPQIIERLKKKVEHGIFGYPVMGDDYFEIIARWIKKRHDYATSPEEYTFVSGVVKGIAFILDAFTSPGDKAQIQPPVYYPFRTVTEQLGRVVVNSPLILENGRYRMDFAGMEKLLKNERPRLTILCNPHNPGGRVWMREELEEFCALCERYGTLIISDEIHADLTLPPHRHTTLGSVSDWARDHSFTLMAPSKTFNIAGLISSFAIIPNESLRKRYRAYVEPRELERGTLFAYEATRTAYTECEDWLEELKVYLQGNIDFATAFCKEHLPQLRLMRPEASFLIWMDCRDLGLNQQELTDLFEKKARLALNNGEMFGKEGRGWMRLNIGLPRKELEKALTRLCEALGDRK